MAELLTEGSFVLYLKLTEAGSIWMRKVIKSILAILAIFILILRYTGPAFVEAATSTASVTLRVTIEPSSQLTLSENINSSDIKNGGNLRTSGMAATASVNTGSSPAILTVTAGSDPLNPAPAATATVPGGSRNISLVVPDSSNGTEPSTLTYTLASP